jgi:D-alanyl-D-alanine carboxypeptidase/D-alanyl-D-alanine-endopeptidase (penicillin-binding protein 4)
MDRPDDGQPAGRRRAVTSARLWLERFERLVFLRKPPRQKGVRSMLRFLLAAVVAAAVAAPVFPGAASVASAQKARAKRERATKPASDAKREPKRGAKGASDDETRRAADGQIATIVDETPEKWGIRVVSLDDDHVVYAHNPDELLQPASCQKVLTTAAALDALGPDWRTSTSVYAREEPDGDGVLEGDLVLYGRGDPNLSDRFSKTGDPLEPFRRLAALVRERGVKRVKGDLVADESYLSGPPHGAGWGWQDLQWYFGTEVSALSFNDNLTRIEVSPGAAPGEPCTIRVVPDIGYVEIVDEISTVASGATGVAVHRSIDTPTVVVGGSITARSRGWSGAVAIHRPALYAAAAFRRALADAGVIVEGPTRAVDAYSRRAERDEADRKVELAAIESEPLSAMIHVVNKKSQNLHAELLLRLLGRERGEEGKPSDEAGVAVVREFLRRIGADDDAATVRDGSGLSRLDRVTPKMLESTLAAMARHPYGAVFADSLPVGGVDGTLRGRLRGLQISAKTGSLTTAKALSGYVTAKSGKRLVFSILFNDRTDTWQAIAKIDRIIAGIASSVR